jgi:hypothetical protein
MYKHSAKFERSVLKTVGELAIAAQTMYCNGVCHDFSVLSAILEDTRHCRTMSIVDTGRFWKILVIPVLQILEDSEKYW